MEKAGRTIVGDGDVREIIEGSRRRNRNAAVGIRLNQVNLYFAVHG